MKPIIETFERDLRDLTEAIKGLTTKIDTLISSHLRIIYGMIVIQSVIILILLGVKDFSGLKDAVAIVGVP